jgi:beta-phosphoglucomutase
MHVKFFLFIEAVLFIADFYYTFSMISTQKITAGLFDLDGVILNTENQYSIFWKNMMQKYKGDASIALKIKGSTLQKIYDVWFCGMEKEQQEITAALDSFERNMKMDYIPGLVDFVQDLRNHNVKCAIVTSSNKAKMEIVFRQHPELEKLFDKILTAEMFAKSKPAPDPYLLGATVFDLPAENCFVFEDSFNGLTSGRAAGMHVIGLATTNSGEEIKKYADMVIPDFTGMTYKKIAGLV